MNFLIYLILAFSKTEHFFNFQSSGDMSMSHQMPMNRMSQQQQQQQSSQQQQQQQQGMVGPPGSSNGPGVGNSMMSNGSDMHQQMSINQVQQNFANNQYHQVNNKETKICSYDTEFGEVFGVMKVN